MPAQYFIPTESGDELIKMPADLVPSGIQSFVEAVTSNAQLVEFSPNGFHVQAESWYNNQQYDEFTLRSVNSNEWGVRLTFSWE